MQKAVSLILCGVISLSLVLTGCGGEKKKNDSGKAPDQSNGSSVVTPNGTLPVVQNKVTMKFFAPQSASIENIETNEFTKEYEQKTNVHIEWQLVPDGGLSNARKLSLASGQYPDAYLGAGITLDEEMVYGTNGVFLALNDLIDKYSVHYKKLLATEPTLRQQLTTPNGKMYSFPFARDTFAMKYNKKLYLNMKWLAQLGLKQPTTTDEFYQVLKAFKDKDPNGNGKADEIPCVLPDAGRTSFFMDAFIYDDGGERFIIDKNNKLDVAFNKPEWRMGIEWLRKLYAEGLLDKASFTIKNNQIKQLVETSQVEVMGGIPAAYVSVFSDPVGERTKNYDVIEPLKGPNGYQTATWDNYINTPGAFVITKECDNPEILVRWVDYLYTWEGALRVREGRENIEWKRPAPGTLSYTGAPATWEKIRKPETGVQNNNWNGITIPHNMYIHKEQASSQDIFAESGSETRNYNEGKKYEKYKQPKTMPTLYMNEDDSQEFAKLKADITGYVNESIVKYITGSGDVTKEWDTYVKNLDNMGVKKYIEIKQKYYDTFLKNNPEMK